MAGQMTDIQSITASIDELDARGEVVPVSSPGNIKWTVGDPSIAELTEVGDGSASFRGLKPGVTPVGVTDTGTGLSAQDTLTVTASAATSLSIKFGAPSDAPTSGDTQPVDTTPTTPVVPITPVPPPPPPPPAFVPPDGSTANPDGTFTLPDGTTVDAQGNAVPSPSTTEPTV